MLVIMEEVKTGGLSVKHTEQGREQATKLSPPSPHWYERMFSLIRNLRPRIFIPMVRTLSCKEAVLYLILLFSECKSSFQ